MVDCVGPSARFTDGCDDIHVCITNYRTTERDNGCCDGSLSRPRPTFRRPGSDLALPRGDETRHGTHLPTTICSQPGRYLTAAVPQRGGLKDRSQLARRMLEVHSGGMFKLGKENLGRDRAAQPVRRTRSSTLAQAWIQRQGLRRPDDIINACTADGLLSVIMRVSVPTGCTETTPKLSRAFRGPRCFNLDACVGTQVQLLKYDVPKSFQAGRCGGKGRGEEPRAMFVSGVLRRSRPLEP